MKANKSALEEVGMILYFSATGNSQYVAQQIAQKTGDETLSLNLLLQQNNHEQLVSASHPFVFVCPTYAWRLPRVVDAYIRSTPFQGTQDVYFVLTCGGETANSIHYVQKLCQHKGWRLKGFAEILMPDNYIVMFPPINKAVATQQLASADIVIRQIAESIRQGSSFFLYTKKGVLGKLASSFVNNMFYPFMVSAKGFHVTEKCISCGKCVQLCPLGNIVLEGKHPVWHKNCTHCMACICGCPTQAIEYKNRTQGKPRYQLSSYLGNHSK